MKFKNKHVLEIKKRNNIAIMVGIVLMIFAFLIISLSIVQNDNDDSSIKPFSDIIESNSRKTGEKAYLNINWLSSKFAFNDKTNSAYYYAFDGNYYYIVFLSETKANELLNSDLNSNPVKIIGFTSRTPNYIKEFAIEDYNSTLEDGKEKLTKDNFYKIFGNVYLNQTISKSASSRMNGLRGVLAFLTGFITTIVGVISSISISSRMKKISDVDVQMLEREMSHSESFYYDKAKVYLTPNYIIMVDGRLLYYKYSDVLWMYSYEHRYKGMRTVKAIKILTKDAKTSMFANLPLATKTQKVIYDEIWNTIASKNPNIKLGYSSENVKYFKGVIKDIKNEKKTGTIF